jgi:hypothetical protein
MVETRRIGRDGINAGGAARAGFGHGGFRQANGKHEQSRGTAYSHTTFLSAWLIRRSKSRTRKSEASCLADAERALASDVVNIQDALKKSIAAEEKKARKR